MRVRSAAGRRIKPDLGHNVKCLAVAVAVTVCCLPEPDSNTNFLRFACNCVSFQTSLSVQCQSRAVIFGSTTTPTLVTLGCPGVYDVLLETDLHQGHSTRSRKRLSSTISHLGCSCGTFFVLPVILELHMGFSCTVPDVRGLLPRDLKREAATSVCWY